MYALGASSGGALVLLLALRMQLQVYPLLLPTLPTTQTEAAQSTKAPDAACVLHASCISIALLYGQGASSVGQKMYTPS